MIEIGVVLLTVLFKPITTATVGIALCKLVTLLPPALVARTLEYIAQRAKIAPVQSLSEADIHRIKALNLVGRSPTSLRTVPRKGRGSRLSCPTPPSRRVIVELKR